MRGEIVAFDAGVGEGEIAGDDFARYRFNAADARSPSSLRTGARVEFTATDDRRATGLSVLASSPTTGGPSGGFDLGRVIQRTFSAIGQNWPVFLGGAAIMVGIPSLLTSWGQANFIQGTPVAFAVFALGAVLFVVGFYLLQGMMLKVAVNGFSGKSTSFASAFDVGVKNALPLFGLAIVAGMAIGVGFIFLIVPGIILSVLWVVGGPVLVAERRDIFESLKRSVKLTKGHRWSIFALLLIYMALSWVLGLAVAGVMFATGGVTAAPSAAVMMPVNFVVNVLQAVVAAAGTASLYYELRTTKEGGGAEELASVFD